MTLQLDATENNISGVSVLATTESRVVISVVIVSYNTAKMTIDCLTRLFADLGDIPAEVFVVDNHSKDGSPAAIEAAFPAVKVIRNQRNAGFGAANNQALKLARGTYVLLLNSDAFVHPGAVREMIAFMESHPRVGVAGPQLRNKDGTLQPSCYRFPSPGRAWLENLWISALLPGNGITGDYRRWPHHEVKMVEWVVGACMLVRAQVLLEVGGFDEAYFMYAEEADWQRRIRDAGWEIGFTPAAVVTHLGGASGAHEKVRINKHFFDSLDLYQRKHHGRGGLVLLRGAMVIGCSLRLFLWGTVALLKRGKREAALSKVRMHGWLVWRQLTHWRSSPGKVA